MTAMLAADAGDGGGVMHYLVIMAEVMGLITLLALITVGYVIWRYQVPPRGVVAMLGALGYLIMPIDALPEAVLGPAGMIDDVGVMGLVSWYVYRLLHSRTGLGLGSKAPAAGTTMRFGGATGRTPLPKSVLPRTPLPKSVLPKPAAPRAPLSRSLPRNR